MNSLKRSPRRRIRFLCSRPCCFLTALLAVLDAFASAETDSDPAHVAAHSKKPLPWPDAIGALVEWKKGPDQNARKAATSVLREYFPSALERAGS